MTDHGTSMPPLTDAAAAAAADVSNPIRADLMQSAAPIAVAKPPSVTGPVTKTVTLSRPIETLGGDKTSIVLTEPNGDVVLRHGLPWKQKAELSDGGANAVEIEYDRDKMASYIEAMSGLDRITLGQMSASDMINCMQVVFQMLQPAGN